MVHAGPFMDCGNDTVTYFGNCTDGSAVNSGQLYYAGTASEVTHPHIFIAVLQFDPSLFIALLFLG